MSDFKDKMIEAIERGEATDPDAYEIVRERMAEEADERFERDWRERRRADLLQDDDGSGVDE